jgi:hypothetical protein
MVDATDAASARARVIWAVEAVFDRKTCADYIALAERHGWDRTGMSTSPPSRYTTGIDIDAVQLFSRIRSTMPQIKGGRILRDVPREKAVCLRYDPGDGFPVHDDGPYRPLPYRGSEYSVIVYLNDGYIGGETCFPDFDFTMIPKTGSALIIEHEISHLARPVSQGRKYALHTFVMYEDIAWDPQGGQGRAG